MDEQPSSAPMATPPPNPEAPPAPRRCWRPWGWRILAAATVLVFAGLSWPGAQKPCIDGDAHSYLGYPKPWEHLGVVINLRRPPVYPLLLKIMPFDYIPHLQATACAVAWCLFGYAVFGYLGLLIAGLFSLSYPVYQFSMIVWSESFSIVFVLLALAWGIFLVRKWSWATFAVYLFFMLCMAWIRDSNLYLLPFFAFPALWQVKHWRRVALLLAFVVAVGLWGYRDAVVCKRWRFGLSVAYLDRIMPNEQARAFCVARGMPYKPEYEKMHHVIFLGNQVPFREKHPEFFEWLDKHGLKVYQQWIMRQPESFTRILKDYRYIALLPFDYQALDQRYAYTGLPWVVQRVKAHWLYNYILPLWVWLALILLPLLDYALNRRVHHLAVIAAILIPAAYVNAFVSYHGDGCEVERHSLVALILYRVSSFVGLAALFYICRDFIISLFKRKGTACPGSESSAATSSGTSPASSSSPSAASR